MSEENKVLALIIVCATAVALGVVGCTAYSNKKYVEGGYCGQNVWEKCGATKITTTTTTVKQ